MTTGVRSNEPSTAGLTRPGRRTQVRGRLPVWVLALAVVAVATLVLPLLALFPRVEWSRFPTASTSPEALFALGLSLRTGAVAVVCCLLLGVPMALVLSRAPAGVAAVLRTLVTLPLVLPPLVGGMALLYLFGRNGWLGQVLEVVGISVPFTPAAVVLAQTFVRSEEHTSELQSRGHLVCRLLLEKKKQPSI